MIYWKTVDRKLLPRITLLLLAFLLLASDASSCSDVLDGEQRAPIAIYGW